MRSLKSEKERLTAASRSVKEAAAAKPGINKQWEGANQLPFLVALIYVQDIVPD